MKIELDLTPGKRGDYEISKFEISEQDAKLDRLRCAINGRFGRAVEAGTYWRLTYKGEVYMSNTPAEIADHERFIRDAKGKVLIAGLGLGMVVKALLEKAEVEKVVVVEKSQEVIDLVGDAYTKDPRVNIVCKDIFDYKPELHFDYAWFDIWMYICGDNYPQMEKLNRKFSKAVTSKDSWCYQQCKQLYQY